MPRLSVAHVPEVMMSQTRKMMVIMLSALAATAGTVASGAPAAGTPVGPDQAFVGSVNGQFSTASIMMACFGPIRAGQTGHPMKGQTLEVLSPPPPIVAGGDIVVGNTGRSATRIVARIVAGGKVYARVSFTDYFAVRNIPRNVELPCAGSGIVRFVPKPRSAGAKASTVSVNFVGQP